MKENTESDAKKALKVNADFRLTRPKRLRKFEKIDGMKVVKSDWIEPEKIKKPQTIRATTAKGIRIEMRRNAAKKAYKERQKLLHGSSL
jgi:hypothetical protein